MRIIPFCDSVYVSVCFFLVEGTESEAGAGRGEEVCSGLPCVECDRVVFDTTEHLVTTETSCSYEPVYQPISVLVFHRRR